MMFMKIMPVGSCYFNIGRDLGIVIEFNAFHILRKTTFKFI